MRQIEQIEQVGRVGRQNHLGPSGFNEIPYLVHEQVNGPRVEAVLNLFYDDQGRRSRMPKERQKGQNPEGAG